MKRMRMVIDPDVLMKGCSDNHPEHQHLLLETMETIDAIRAKVRAPIFLSYAEPDRIQVETIYEKLDSDGFAPWMDVKKVLPGQRPVEEAKKAIWDTLIFIACLSNNSVNARGKVQREFGIAQEVSAEMRHDDIFIIPLKLEECGVPDDLKEYEPACLSENGYEKLKTSIRREIERRISGSKAISCASDIFHLCLDNGGEILKTYEVNAVGSPLTQQWFQHLRDTKMFHEQWDGGCDEIDFTKCEDLGCLKPCQGVCVGVAANSSSELVLEGGDAAQCHACNSLGVCRWPHHIHTSVAPVLPIKTARQRLASLRKSL